MDFDAPFWLSCSEFSSTRVATVSNDRLIYLQCIVCGSKGFQSCDHLHDSHADATSLMFRLQPAALQPYVRFVLSSQPSLCIAADACGEGMVCVIQPIEESSIAQCWTLSPTSSYPRYHAFHYIPPQREFLIQSAGFDDCVIDICRQDGQLLVYPSHGGVNQRFILRYPDCSPLLSDLTPDEPELLNLVINTDVQSACKMLQSPDIRLRCLRYELLSLLNITESDVKSPGVVTATPYLPGVRWYWNSIIALQYLLDSGGCTPAHDGSEYAPVPLCERWRNALHIFSALIELHSDLRTCISSDSIDVPFILKMAIATALAFSSGVPSHAGLKLGLLDPISRFALYKQWAFQSGVLFHQFSDLSAWHMRYVLGSWATNDELEWAQKHCPVASKTIDKVALSAHDLVKYCETDPSRNHVSVHDPEAFYNGLAPTMPILMEYGAVCGGISKFGSAMAHAHGVPATPVGQPGHCAYVWMLHSGTFSQLSNRLDGWNRTTRHGGSQIPWDLPPFALPFMERCQLNPNYADVQRVWTLLTLVPLEQRFDFLIQLLDLCVDHLGVWLSLIQSFKAIVQSNPAFSSCRLTSASTSTSDHLCSHKCKVDASESHPDDPQNITLVDPSEWRCRARQAWFTVDLGAAHYISAIKLRWWGYSCASQYTISTSSDAGADRTWTARATQSEAHDSGEICNNIHSLTISSWNDVPVRYLRVDLDASEGDADPWFHLYFIGLRGFDVFGRRKANASQSSSADTATLLRSYIRDQLVNRCDNVDEFEWRNAAAEFLSEQLD